MSNVKKTKSSSKKVAPNVEEQIVEGESHGVVGETGEENLQEMASGSGETSVSQESDSSKTPVKRDGSMGSPILRSILTGSPRTPEKTIQSEDKCNSPILKRALTRPQTPESSPEKKTRSQMSTESSDKTPVLRSMLVAPVKETQPYSPTKAMRDLKLTSPKRSVAGHSAQQVGEQQEQASNLPETVRSRTKSATIMFDSPYNTRSKTKRIRDKEQRSASEETAKRKGKDKEFEKPL